MNGRRYGYIVLYTIILLAGIFLSISAHQSQFYGIFSGAALAFLGCVMLYRMDLSFKELLWIGVGIRVFMIPVFPMLSDDIYRFYWDGRLIWNGVSPYAMIPSEVPIENMTGLDTDIHEKMNSPQYFSVYPPVTQLIYAVSSIGSLQLSMYIMKIIILLADVLALSGIFIVLKHFQRSTAAAALYFLNPLVLIEGVGNLHFEGIMAALVLWGGICVFVYKRQIAGALLLALAIGVKLVPLIYLPYLAIQSLHRRDMRLLYLLVTAVALVLSPLFFGLDIFHFMDSIDLYFRKFEFNASVYYLLRYVGKVISGYNLIAFIGPLLAIANIVIIMWKSIKERSYNLDTFLHVAFFTTVIYYFLSTTVHPWYLIMPLLMGIVIQRWWIVGWTILIFLSYSHYQGGDYQENYVLIFIEYVGVLSAWALNLYMARD